MAIKANGNNFENSSNKGLITRGKVITTGLCQKAYNQCLGIDL